MPDTTEAPMEDSHPTDSSSRIITLWRKFHFSGRVIMCSVLLGLGLILIGALVFVINMDDDNVNKIKSDDGVDVPIKAPSNYSGPVVMGIGTFIVTVGVIMCLFETQVCRKKTADSKPLISESADDAEKKVSDPASVPSTSHGHKVHRHGARKASRSPRKHKSRHGNSHSRERNQQKSPSPKSLPVSIETPRYLTSSGENFLTPPNTLDEHSSTEKDDSRKVSDKNTSLMKSFTSSDPSWNQSAEFLTPSTSFRDASLSLNNSIEIDPSQVESNVSTELTEKQLTNYEYFTPLTLEEDRIQQLLIRVKSEQKQTSDTIQPVEAPENLKPEDNLSSSLIKKESGKSSVREEKTENGNSISNGQQSTAHRDSSISKENKLIKLGIENTHKLEENKDENIITETNEGNIVSETGDNALNENSTVFKAKILPASTNEQEEVFQTNPHPDLKKPGDLHLGCSSDKEAPDSPEEINETQNDFDSSVSSNETVISPDSFQDNPAKTKITREKEFSAELKEDLSIKESNCLSIPKLTSNDATHENQDSVNQINTISSDKVEAINSNAIMDERVETLNVSDDASAEVQNKESVDQINTETNTLSSDKVEVISPNAGVNEPVETLSVNEDASITNSEYESKDGLS